MQRRPHSSWLRTFRRTAFRRIAGAAVLLMFCTSLLRFLVVCSGPHCQESVEFAHAGDVCCRDAIGHAAHGHGAATADTADAGDPAPVEPAASPCGCVDSPCAVDLGPLPQRAVCPDLQVGATAFAWIDWSAPPSTGHERTGPPPATGPPRGDRRTTLRLTTVLLL